VKLQQITRIFCFGVLVLIGKEHPERERPQVDDVNESDESGGRTVNQPDPSEWTVVKRRVHTYDTYLYRSLTIKRSTRYSRKHEEKKSEDVSSPHALKIIPS
jgi:hypothetical protein